MDHGKLMANLLLTQAKYNALRRFLGAWFDNNRVLTADVCDAILYALDPDIEVPTDEEEADTENEGTGRYYDE